MEETITVKADHVGQRLDIFCVAHAPHYSRGVIQKAIKAGHISVNGQTVKPRYSIQENDVVTVHVVEQQSKPAGPLGDDLALPILFENNDLVAINKPPGLAVHPGIAREQQTVAAWFAQRYPEAATVGEDQTRPGIVHRLDKDTTGVLVLAKTPEAYAHLKESFKKHRVAKEYLALVFGVPNTSEGRITRPLARSKRNPLRRTVDEKSGKPAITEWRLEQKLGEKYALLRVMPLTGRTHQIRVHLHFVGHPIIGDPLYTFKRQSLPRGLSAKAGQLLHAEKLTLKLPSGKRKTFTAPLPKDFVSSIDKLNAS